VDQEVQFVWDGHNVIHELDSDRGLISWQWEPESFTPIAKEHNGRRWTIASDHLGTPTEMYDDLGQLAWKMQLDVFGVPSFDAGTAEDCPWRWPGQYEDGGTSQRYSWNRYYEPKSGAFVSQDPLRARGGPRLYGYPPDGNVASDPTGLLVEYGALDAHGRPTGGFADITASDLRPTDSSEPTLDPPGWLGGKHPHHHQRSHLIGDTLGGSGSDARNLVALTDGSNHPGMSVLEGRVRRYLRDTPGARVLLEVTAQYDTPSARVPDRIRMTALGTNGELLFDQLIPNGLRQKTLCCP
jgi:RHS repeat-associated protein